MTLHLEDLPTLESAGRLGRRPPADSRVDDAYRMQAGPSPGDVGSLGLTVGFELADLLQAKAFPGGKRLAELRMARSSPSYTTYNDCTIYNYDGTCDEACFGFAPHHMDPFYCATCDEQAADPKNNPSFNWHFVGSRGSLDYWDREPDVCNGRDAWKWKVGTCGRCEESAIFRCHDGYKRYTDGTVAPTICQGLIACDDKLNLCP